MHLPVLKALIAVIAASIVAIGVALEPAAGKPQHAHRSAAASQSRSLESDGLEFLVQLVAGNVKPDATLKESWTDDVTAVAHSLGLTDRALAGQLSAGRSLSQIAASQGVPASAVTAVLLRHVSGDIDQAEHDQAISPTAARALDNAISTVLGIR
jgi:hypothetical protein